MQVFNPNRIVHHGQFGMPTRRTSACGAGLQLQAGLGQFARDDDAEHFSLGAARYLLQKKAMLRHVLTRDPSMLAIK
jgi:hypothetical protein